MKKRRGVSNISIAIIVIAITIFIVGIVLLIMNLSATKAEQNLIEYTSQKANVKFKYPIGFELVEEKTDSYGYVTIKLTNETKDKTIMVTVGELEKEITFDEYVSLNARDIKEKLKETDNPSEKLILKREGIKLSGLPACRYFYVYNGVQKCQTVALKGKTEYIFTYATNPEEFNKTLMNILINSFVIL